MLALAGLGAAGTTSEADASRPPVVPHLTPALVRFWTTVQSCEEGVTGWTTRGSRYEGGTGMAVTTWALWAGELGLSSRYPHAWMAPPIVQMEVSEYGWERGGFWGTIEPHGSCAGWHP